MATRTGVIKRGGLRGNRHKTPLTHQIARALTQHLYRFQDDDALNPIIGRLPSGKPERFFYRPRVHVYADRRIVSIKYRCYGGGIQIKLDEAKRYLDWLDAGGVGPYERMLSDIMAARVLNNAFVPPGTSNAA